MNINEFEHVDVTDSTSFFDQVDELINTKGYRWIIHIDWAPERGLSYFFIHPERLNPYLLNVEAASCRISWPSLSTFFHSLSGIEESIYEAGGPQFQHKSWTARYQWPSNSELPELRSKIMGDQFKQGGPTIDGTPKWLHTIGLEDVFAGQFAFHLEGRHSSVERSEFVRGLYRTSWCDRASELNWRQLLNQTNAIAPGTPYFANLALVESIEDQLGVVVTERASAIRMILSELSRIFDHLQSLHTLWFIQGVNSWEDVFVDLGVQVYELLGRYARGEWTGQLNTIGGVRHDLPEDWKNQLLVLTGRVIKKLDGAQLSIERSPGLISTLSNIHLGLKDVMDHTLTGPVARACGLRRDLRKLSGRYFYHEVDFEIPLGINSTFYDVVLVKIEEMRQSLSILAQILDGLPYDSIQNPQYALFWNVPEYSILSDEERSDVLTRLKKGPGPLHARSMGMVESARGELSVIWEDQEGAKPRKISIVSPSRQMSYFIEKRAVGLNVSEVYSMCALAHLSPEEMDI